MVGQLTWETQASATYIFQTSLKTNKHEKWKLLFLGRPLSMDGLTGELDTMELASNLYQFPLGSDQPMLSYQLAAVRETHRCVCVLKTKRKPCYAFFLALSLQWDYNGPCCLSLSQYSLIDNTLGDVTVLAPCIVIACRTKGALGPSSPLFFQVL